MTFCSQKIKFTFKIIIFLDCDYINASWIRGFNHNKEFIATQNPTVDTIPDFWQMVRENNVKLIVMLAGSQMSFIQEGKNYRQLRNLKSFLTFVNMSFIQEGQNCRRLQISKKLFYSC